MIYIQLIKISCTYTKKKIAALAAAMRSLLLPNFECPHSVRLLLLHAGMHQTFDVHWPVKHVKCSREKQAKQTIFDYMVQHRISSTYLSRAEGERVFSVDGFSLAPILSSLFLISAHSRLCSLKSNNNPNCFTLIARQTATSSDALLRVRANERRAPNAR